MLKGIGYVLIVVGLVWLFFILSMDLLALRADEKSLSALVGHWLLVGLLPCLIAFGGGGVLIVTQQKKDREDTDFETEQQILLLLNKEDRLSFQAILGELKLNQAELRRILIGMGEKRLFTGYIDMKSKMVVSGDDLELSGGECPVCGSLTGSLHPKRAVCTRCETNIFLA